MRDMEPKDQQLTVALRIRPLSDTEQEEGATVIAHKVGDQLGGREGAERDQQAVALAGVAGDEGESAEPHEGALSGEEAAPLLPAKRNAAALQAELEQGLASPRGKVAPELEAQEAGAENTAWLAAHLLAQRDLLIGHLRQHPRLCEQIIGDQRQLIQALEGTCTQERAPDQNPPKPGCQANAPTSDHASQGP
uniref:Uncharacterized protein n=1 Tax=Pipistrellus kuhlii TaxID=59472 RepID=A0A7J7XAV3_PIPKU|nr:hypothetical protein mPipKuh1_010568 [Pipistrellus kuhlii]